MWDEISNPFPNFSDCTTEVWEWISNFISHFTGHEVTYPCWDVSNVDYIQVMETHLAGRPI